VAARIGGGPEGQDVDAAIGVLRGDIDGTHDVAGGAMPGKAEFACAGLDCGDDLIGDVLVNVEALLIHNGFPLMYGPRECGLVGRGTGTRVPGDQTPRPKGAPQGGAKLHKRSAEASRVDREVGPANVPT
jgi:hypothetical protein